jgi:hypothetical protein
LPDLLFGKEENGSLAFLGKLPMEYIAVEGTGRPSDLVFVVKLQLVIAILDNFLYVFDLKLHFADSLYFVLTLIHEFSQLCDHLRSKGGSMVAACVEG